MSYLHNLPKIGSRPSKRRGRGLGSGKGSKSGRGTTRHQTARTTIPLGFEGGQGRMTKRFPLMRGKARNKSAQEKAYAVRLSALAKLSDTAQITLAVLIEKSLVPKNTKKVKVVFDTEVTSALTVHLPASKRAVEAIASAGGKVIV